MNRSDLIKKVSQESDVTQAQIEQILDLLMVTIEETLASGENVVIKNFGKFEVRDRAPTVRRNPRSGTEIKVPRRRAVLFHPSPAFKENIQE